MTATLFFLPMPVAFTSNGLPAAGAKLYFYASGSSTPAPIYTTSALNVEHPNPVPANGAGRFPSIYLNSSVTYRLVITDKNDVHLDDVDPFVPGEIVAGMRGAAGTNGGTASNLTIGRFVGAAGQDLTAGGTKPAPEVVYTSGHTLIGKGSGCYVLDAAVDSAFVAAHPGWSFRDSQGNGYRLSPSQLLSLETFGAAGDATPSNVGTDDYPAFLSARDFQHYYRYSPSGNTDYKPAPVVWLSNRGYRSSATWIFDREANRFFGTGNNAAGYGGSYVFFDAGVPGIVIQCWDNVGTSLTGTYTHHTYGTDPRGAQACHLADFSILSRGGTVGNDGQNGVLVHTQCTLDRIHAFDFGGNGVAIMADVGGGTNANASQVNDCGAQRCGLNGYYDQGGDVNAGRNLSFQAFNNRQFGVYAGNFLGQYYLWFQTDGNGISGSGPGWATNNVSTFTNYGGHIWRVRPGAHAAASTTTPGTNANVWVDLGAGSTPFGGGWVSGQTFSSGGAFYAGGAAFASNNNARNVFAGYAEGNQASGWSDSNTSICMPGFSGWNGPDLYAAQNKVLSPAIGARVAGVTANHIVNISWGNPGGAFDNVFGQLGNATDESQPWSFHCDDNNQVYQRYAAADGSEAYRMYPPGYQMGMAFGRGIDVEGVQFHARTAVPSSGTWSTGTIVKNKTPAVGQPKGWVCTVGGTPGTWVSEGNL